MCFCKNPHFFRSKKRNTLIFTTIINKTKIKILSMKLQTKEFVDTLLGLINHDTQKPIDAKFTNIVLLSSNPAIFTASTDINADGKIDIVGVSVGKASLTVTADVTYLDANTSLEVTASKSAVVDVEITAPAPTAENTDLVVTFTAPAPVV